MIKFKKLTWSNVFSYGPDNEIQFDANPLTQLLGVNGSGKSSIAAILEEGLFNTNSKKIKKGNILNRYTKEKKYFISVEFDKDGTQYVTSTSRTGATSTVTLLANGVDISSHTATATYKQIELILGFDHKIFSQIVYQSGVSSLEFLTATDTDRKKFLIGLLNLSSYTNAADHFKALTSAVSKEVDAAQTKLNTIETWISRNEGTDLTLRELVEVPVQPTELQSELTTINNTLAGIVATNKKITQNNTYKTILDGLVLPEKPAAPADTKELEVQLLDLSTEAKIINSKLLEGTNLAKKCKGPTIKCPTCSQDMDNSTMFSMVQDFDSKRGTLEESLKVINTSIELIRGTLAKTEVVKKRIDAYNKAVAEWEKYHALYDSSMGAELLDRAALEARAAEIKQVVAQVLAEIDTALAANRAAEAWNAKVAVVEGQLASMREDREEVRAVLAVKLVELSNLQVLVKTFSTTGLVAYKIECLVKDLEDATNEYLTAIADGRFQLSFKITASDKLNVVITDNGNDVDMNALSFGERARVNVAALLGIRRLTQALSNSRTNLLILDETISNLDAYGKEKLVEILLEEGDLNTFLISHDFTHPLLEKITIVKENNVSRIE